MSELIKLESTNLINPIIKLFEKIGNEWDNSFKNGLSEYLHSQTEKYYLTNTFLYLNEKVKFYDIYYPIKAKYKELSTDFIEDFEDVLINYKNIALIGIAGCGKTTLIRHIFLNSILTKNKIPILIELRNLNTFSGTLESLILEKVLKTKTKPSEEIFKRTLNSGKYVFLLDGFDEIFSEKRVEIVRQIELFIDSNSGNNFIISSRPGSNVENFPRFYPFTVEELTSRDIVKFVNINVKIEETNKRILEVINENKNADYKNYLKNPLLLSMFILAIYSHPEIPSRKNIFYKNVFDTLYSRHDAHTKNSFLREKFAKLEREDYEVILEKFSFIASIEGKFEFSEEYLTEVFYRIKLQSNYSYKIDDLIKDYKSQISILLQDGFIFTFPHRSMQEYFMARFVSKLPEKSKIDFYKKLKIISKNSNDNQNNFFLMCEELDKIALYKYHVIPLLKNFITSISGDDAKLINEYNEIGSIFLRIDQKTNIIEGTILSFPNGNYFHDLMIYFNVKSAFILLNKKIKNKKSSEFVIFENFKLNKNVYFSDEDSIAYEIKSEDDGIIYMETIKYIKEEISHIKELANRLESVVLNEIKIINEFMHMI